MRSKQMAVSIGALLFASALVLPLSYFSRPIADDYCLAARVNTEGFVGSIVDQWNHWSGAIVTDAAASIAGFFISSDQMFLGNFIFLLAFILIGSATFLNFIRGGGGSAKEKPQIWNALTVIGVSVIVFIGFLLNNFGYPAFIGSAGMDRESRYVLGYQFIGWQAAALSQLLPALLFVLATTLYSRELYERRTSRRVALFLIVGLLGVMNFQAPLAFIASMILLSAFEKPMLRRNLQLGLLLGCLALSSAAVNYFSPGTQNRSTFLSDAPIDIFTNLAWSGYYVLQSVADSAILVPILIGICLGLRRSNNFSHFRKNEIALSICLFLGALFATFATDLLSYTAAWHQAAVRVTFYLLVVAISAGCASRLEPSIREKRFTSGIFLASCLAALFLMSTNVMTLVYQSQIRSVAWDAGVGSPVSWIPDRETEWVRTCWSQIEVN